MKHLSLKGFRLFLMHLRAGYSLRLTISYFYPAESVAQLYIYDVYHGALPEELRGSMAFVVSIQCLASVFKILFDSS